MPGRSPTKDRHSRRSVSRGRKVSETKTDVHRVQHKNTEKIGSADIAIEARAVEAVLAGRSQHTKKSCWDGMDKPFYGRTGALDSAQNGFPIIRPRFTISQQSKGLKWFPSLLTLPQRILDDIIVGDGVDPHMIHFLNTACIYQELCKLCVDSAHHGALLRDVLRWHRVSGELCAHAAQQDNGNPSFQFYIPSYDLRVLKDGNSVGCFTTVTRRAVTFFGRDREVNDIPIDHPSCSAQHAALEVRFVYASEVEMLDELTAFLKNREINWKSQEDINVLCTKAQEIMRKFGCGVDSWSTELLVVDLQSSNGTRLNDVPVRPHEPATLIEGDVLTFGVSTRRYVVVRSKKQTLEH